MRSEAKQASSGSSFDRSGETSCLAYQKPDLWFVTKEAHFALHAICRARKEQARLSLSFNFSGLRHFIGGTSKCRAPSAKLRRGFLILIDHRFDLSEQSIR
jgi:hypothetical protein